MRTNRKPTWPVLWTLATLVMGIFAGGAAADVMPPAEDPAPPVAPAPPPPPPPAPRPAPEPTIAVGRCEQGAITVEMHAPRTVRPNQPFTFRLRVSNRTNDTLRNVVVRFAPPETYQMTTSAPAARRNAAGEFLWELGTMEGQAATDITIQGFAGKVDRMVPCITVSHEIVCCWAIGVAEPELTLTHQLPADVLACDDIPVSIVVANRGNGVAEQVRLEYALPDGLLTQDGRQSVQVDIGDLAPTQSRRVDMRLRATKPGDYSPTAVIRSRDGVAAQAPARIVVRQPRLAITKEGRDNVFIGRPISYTVTLANIGDVEARDVVVVDQVPAGARITGVSAGGQINPQTNQVTWRLGTLPAQSRARLRIDVTPDQAGTLNNTVTATAYCANPVQATAQTRVSGIPAILLEVIDLEDPAEVGSTTTYVIEVLNQGTAMGTNIIIECELEDSMEFVSATGITQLATREGRRLRFAPLGQLASKAKAEWRVVVRAIAPGDVRFGVKMNSDQISRPVEETEATHFYK